jgi:hypothetical protein
LLAVRMNDLLEPPAMPARFRQRQHEQDAEQHEQAERRRRRIEHQPSPEERGDARRDGSGDAGEREQRRVVGLPSWSGPDERESEQYERGELDRWRPTRAGQPALVVEVLEHLRVNFAAGHALAQRRVLVVDRGQAGSGDQDELVPKAQRVDLAVEDIDGRNVATRVSP